LTFHLKVLLNLFNHRTTGLQIMHLLPVDLNESFRVVEEKMAQGSVGPTSLYLLPLQSSSHITAHTHRWFFMSYR